MLTARDRVTERMALQATRFPDLDLSPLDISGLDGRDAALALALEHAGLRRWLTLKTVIESRLSRPWADVEAKLQAALLVGAAQLLLFDRLPDHAVINEAVEWVKRNVRPGAGGFVNAVLRKVAALRQEKRDQPPFSLPLGDGRGWALNEDVFDQSPMRRLAQQTSHPEALIEKWLTEFGAARTTGLALHSLVQPPIIAHGLGSIATPSADVEPHHDSGFFIYQGLIDRLPEFLRLHPEAIVQDPTSAEPVRATANLDPPPQLIIDACAGMGTKTRQLAHTHPNARIIATDVEAERLATLRRQFAHASRVQVVEYDRLRDYAGQADLLLLDVPCSNTGVLARRVEAKYRADPATLQQLVNLQRRIIDATVNLLGRGGFLLYSTCSVEPEENQQEINWIQQRHSLALVQEQARVPEGLPGEPLSIYRDGGFFALLKQH